VCDTQFTLILFFLSFWTNVQSKRTIRAEPEDHLWSADHSLRNAGLAELLMQFHVLNGTGFSTANDNEQGSFFHMQEESGAVPWNRPRPQVVIDLHRKSLQSGQYQHTAS